MRLPADTANNMTAEELAHYLSLDLIERPDADTINNHIASNLTTLREELDHKESQLQEAYGEIEETNSRVDELKRDLDQIVERRGKGIKTISPPVAASCNCAYSDSWRCARAKNASFVACHCVCHREGPRWYAEEEKPKMKNIMIDLETMSTESNAAILSIGAVEMNFETRALGSEFYTNVTLSSCLKLGLHRSQSTFEWWSKDENKVARDMLRQDAISIEAAVVKFIVWCESMGDATVIVPWSNGAGFDLPILANAIRTCGRKPPWEFRNESCFRTLKRLFYSVRVPRSGNKHHALEDAKHQANHLMAIMEALMVRIAGGAVLPIDMQEKSKVKT